MPADRESGMTQVVRFVRGGWLGLVLAGVAVVGAVALAQSGNGRAARAGSAQPYTQWTAYGGGSHSSQFSALNQINKKNVAQLQVAWTYPVTGNMIFNPIVIDGVMYVQGSGNAIVALDAATGKEIWTPSEHGRHRRARASTTGRAPTVPTGGCCISMPAT